MVGVLIADPRTPWSVPKEIGLLSTSVIPGARLFLIRAGNNELEIVGTSLLSTIDLWESHFAHLSGWLSLSLWLTKGKPLGSHGSNGRCQG